MNNYYGECRDGRLACIGNLLRSERGPAPLSSPPSSLRPLLAAWLDTTPRHYSGRGRYLRYICESQVASCLPPQRSITGRVLDHLVTEQVLTALQPGALELSLAAVDDVLRERQRLDDNWQQRLECARYQTPRAERQYQAVEPENRLVARTLERQWEESLEEVRRLEEDYARFRRQQPAPLTEQEVEQIRALAQDLPALWQASTTTSAIPTRSKLSPCGTRRSTCSGFHNFLPVPCMSTSTWRETPRKGLTTSSACSLLKAIRNSATLSGPIPAIKRTISSSSSLLWWAAMTTIWSSPPMRIKSSRHLEGARLDCPATVHIPLRSGFGLGNCFVQEVRNRVECECGECVFVATEDISRRGQPRPPHLFTPVPQS